MNLNKIINRQSLTYIDNEKDSAYLKSKYHVQFLPFEPGYCIGILSHRQGLAAYTKYKPANLHYNKAAQ